MQILILYEKLHILPAGHQGNCLKKIGIERMNGFKILLRMAFPALPYVLLAVALNSLKIWGDVMVFASRSAMLNDIKFGSEEGLNVIKQTTLSFIVLRCFFECVGMLTQFLRSSKTVLLRLPRRFSLYIKFGRRRSIQIAGVRGRVPPNALLRQMISLLLRSEASTTL